MEDVVEFLKIVAASKIDFRMPRRGHIEQRRDDHIKQVSTSRKARENGPLHC